MDALNGKPQAGKFPKKYKNGELLELHETEGRNFASVLLSPSMMEGVDLVDELSRFQVIIKLPWANLGDVRIKAKSQIDGEWYTNKMWVNILQSSGRSTRHEEDFSITYILDSNFRYFYDQWKHKLPNWFKSRLVF
jgi:Rad3-related DNA helicase